MPATHISLLPAQAPRISGNSRNSRHPRARSAGLWRIASVLALGILAAACSSSTPTEGSPTDGGDTRDVPGQPEGGSPKEAGRPVEGGRPDDAGKPVEAGRLDDGGMPGDSGPRNEAGAAGGQVYVILFTHIEDQTPGGTLGTDAAKNSYLSIRSKLVEVAQKASARKLQWVLQPDWKILLAAQQYEDASAMASTGGKNFLRYLKEDLGAVIDPHSHENGGYNYTDVAYLLEQLGVGGSTVIGGHIWDPSLPQFQDWDRFRVAIKGQKYPTATWRGDILIGAGTPNHVNDPIASGVWRPKDKNNFFVDDPNGNIVAVGAFHNDVTGVQELVNLYAKGSVAPTDMLTASWNITPSSITAAGGVDAIDSTIFAPLATMRDAGTIKVTDFTSLVSTWKTTFGAKASLYRQ